MPTSNRARLLAAAVAALAVLVGGLGAVGARAQTEAPPGRSPRDGAPPPGAPSRTGPEVSVTAPAGFVANGVHVALGDSYTAGPLVPLPAGDPPGCGRSTSNYPRVTAAALGLALTDVSCSGARTDHLLRPQAVAGGVNPPQLDAVTASAAVVTVGIGGNDIGFAGIVQACTAPAPSGTPCRDRYDTPAGDEISRRIAATAPKVTAVLAEAGRRAPSARVFALGYPAILPDSGPGCWPVMPVAPGDVPYLRARHKELNAMIAASAAAAGATYVDVYTPSVGHDACQLVGGRWVEPAVPTTPAAPVHPNALGMKGMGRALAAAIDPAGAPAPAPAGGLDLGLDLGRLIG